MRLSLTILTASLFALTGCSIFQNDPPPPDPLVFFCGQTEDFRYVQAEIDARQAWPANLAREFRINERRDRWCDAP